MEIIHGERRITMSLQQIQQFFDRHAARWDYSLDEGKIDYLRTIFKELIVQLKTPVLDLGCGTGVLLKVLPGVTENPHDIIVELDISAEMLSQIRYKQNEGARPVCLTQGDGHKLPFAGERFGSVIAFQTFPHFINPLRVIKEVYRVLRPGGYFCILHLADHKRLNNLHRNAGGAVKDHYMPPAFELANRLKKSGFVPLQTKEKEDIYLVLVRK